MSPNRKLQFFKANCKQTKAFASNNVSKYHNQWTIHHIILQITIYSGKTTLQYRCAISIFFNLCM